MPLGPILEDHFSLPVFTSNDGDLFAYGEAMAGLLPWANARLAEAGSPRRYTSLFGATIGTGFGGGIVSEGRLLREDNSMAAEIWLFRDKLHPSANTEEGASIRAVRRAYALRTGTSTDAVTSTSGRGVGNCCPPEERLGAPGRWPGRLSWR